MKIAIYHNLPSGGGKRALYEITKKLASVHLIDIFSLSTADHTFCDLRPFARNCQVYPFEPARLFTSPLGRLNQWQRARDLERLEGIGRVVADEIDSADYDVVFVHHCRFTQAPLVLKHLKTPSIYYCQETLRSLYEPSTPRPQADGDGVRGLINWVDPLIQYYGRRLMAADRMAARSADKVLVNSRFSQRNIDQAYGVESTVAYLGVDADAFCPDDNPQRENYVLSVGSLQGKKGFGFLIDALALLHDRERPALRIIANAGDRNEQEFLENHAASAGVQLSIELLVSQETLVDAYRRALAVVYAPIREPFGFVPLEAMGCGTAVVGVAEGGVTETIIHGETGFLVPRDPARFAARLGRLIADPETAAAIGRVGREVVTRNWSWEAAARRIENHLFITAGLSLN